MPRRGSSAATSPSPRSARRPSPAAGRRRPAPGGASPRGRQVKRARGPETRPSRRAAPAAAARQPAARRSVRRPTAATCSSEGDDSSSSTSANDTDGSDSESESESGPENGGESGAGRSAAGPPDDDAAARETDMRWKGPPIGTGTGAAGEAPLGTVRYAGFVVDGAEYEVGDAVLLNSGGSGERLLARVADAWEDEYRDKWLSARWYLAPEETAGGRLPEHHAQEVFLTSSTDDNTIDCVLRKVQVLRDNEFSARGAGADPESTFLCRSAYDEGRGVLLPLAAEPPQPQAPEASSQQPEGAPSQRPQRQGRRQSQSLSQGQKPRPTPHPAAAPPKSGGHGAGAGRPDVLAAACAQLQLSAVPDTLPGREREHDTIKSFLVGAVKRGGLSGGLYISGMPGTGKTATVHQVVREMGQMHDAGELPRFQYVEINGMRLATPTAAYTVLYEALTGVHAHHKRAALLLDEYFGKPNSRRPCVVVLVDELDYIVTRKQQVIYSLFDWPCRRHARLVVVGIANTMDLPERLLPRVHSRLGLARLTFAPYTREELETIIQARLRGLRVFHDDALEFCARKVASVSGDVRRALQICRRAAELCTATAPAAASSSASSSSSSAAAVVAGERGATVTIAHIDAAVADLFNSCYVEMIRSLSTHECLFLAAVLLEARARHTDLVPLEAAAERHGRMAQMAGLRVPRADELDGVCAQLVELRILESVLGEGPRRRTVRMVVQADDVSFAFRENELWRRFVREWE